MSLNILASSKEIYRFMKGPKNWKCVSVDLTSAEPFAVAHYSACPVYMSLYGPNAVPNQDAYILLGTTIPQYADKFLAHYDPKAPTKEGVEFIKKNYEKERFVCKTTFLSCVYGIQPIALQASLAAGGVEMTIREVEHIHSNYWKTFKAVKNLTKKLQAEWRENGGYIITGRGTPKPMDIKAASKDCLSRFIQTSCHQWVMRWIWHINNIRQERGIIARPIVKDMHDSTTWTCPDKEAEATGQMIQDGLTRLNEELKLSVTLRGDTKIGTTLEILG